MRPRELDMLHGPLAGKILIFAVPLMITGVLQLLFNVTDIIVVGRYVGPESLAAVGATNSLVNFYVNSIIGISVGVNVLVAHELGAGNMKQVKLAVHTGALFSVFLGLALGAIGFAASFPILQAMNTPSDIIGLSALYLRIYCLGVPFQSIYNVCAAILRAKGDTERPLLFLLFSGILNVCLNLLFVTQFGMNVSGVAVATVISQFVSMVLIVRCLLREKEPIQLSLTELRIDILRIGIPSAVQGMLFSFSNLVIQKTVNSFGSVVVAGNSAAMSIEVFVYACMNAITQAAQTFVSQNFGAREFDRVERTRKLCLFWTVVFGLVLGNIVYYFGSSLCGIYATEPAVIAAGVTRLKYITTVYFTCGTMEVMAGVLRGIGLSVVPMITSFLGACVFRLIWVALAFPLNPVIENLYISYLISWVLTTLAHRVIWHFAWKKARK